MDFRNDDLKKCIETVDLKNIENNGIICNNLDTGNNSNIKEPVSKKKSKKNKCYNCNKKLGLIVFDCKCGNKYCSKCRQAEIHNCSYDYIKEGRDILEKENPKLSAKKIDKID